jgi:membrane protein DedA with SNARE-associated domain
MLEAFTLEVVELVRQAPLWSVYILFFLIAYAENVVPPIPGDVLVAFAGYLAAEGVLRFDLLLLGSTLASVAGFMSMHAIGSRWGDGINEKKQFHWMFKYISFTYADRARRWMNRWGIRVILANRFLAGTRSVIALMSGISHVPVRTAIWSSAVSALLWNALLLGAGWMIRENWEQIGVVLNRYGQAVLLGVVVFAVYKIWRTFGMKDVDK